MTLPVWPAELPRPERNTFQLVPAEARLKRRSDAGSPSYRLRFSGVPKLVSMSILVNRAGRAVFDEFHRDTTRWGTLPFTMPDPTTEGWALTDTDGTPITNAGGKPILLSGSWTCLFGDGMPVETVVGREFRKAFTITVLP